MTVSREKLQGLKRQAREAGFVPSVQVVHMLVDHGLAVLDELEGGKSTVEQRAALKERERQLGLGLTDLRVLISEIVCAVPVDVYPAVVEGQPLVDDLARAVFTVDMMSEMLKARGPAWHREWSWYQPRIAEEFDE
jgi:hypothetical protein